MDETPRIEGFIEAPYCTGARVAELVQLKRQRLVAETEGKGGHVTLYGKHGSRRPAHLGGVTAAG